LEKKNDSLKLKQNLRDFNDHLKRLSTKTFSKEIFTVIVKQRISLDKAQGTEKNNSHLFFREGRKFSRENIISFHSNLLK